MINKCSDNEVIQIFLTNDFGCHFFIYFMIDFDFILTPSFRSLLIKDIILYICACVLGEMLNFVW